MTFIRSCSLLSTVDTDTSFLDNDSVCSIHHTQDCRVSCAGVVKIKYEDRIAQPPCLKDAQAPLTPETYQSKMQSSTHCCITRKKCILRYWLIGMCCLLDKEHC